MLDRKPDYVILSGGGSIADLSGLDIGDPDGLVKDWLDGMTRKEQDMGKKKAKLDLTISLMRKDVERSRRKGYSHSSVLNSELEALLEWAAHVREKNPFLIGDRVKLATTGDPDDAPEPEEGVVAALTVGAVIVDAGELGKTLWYPFESVTRIED